MQAYAVCLMTHTVHGRQITTLPLLPPCTMTQLTPTQKHLPPVLTHTHRHCSRGSASQCGQRHPHSHTAAAAASAAAHERGAQHTTLATPACICVPLRVWVTRTATRRLHISTRHRSSLQSCQQRHRRHLPWFSCRHQRSRRRLIHAVHAAAGSHGVQRRAHALHAHLQPHHSAQFCAR